MKAASYDYPAGGGYADTVATLDDGRRVWINTQYASAIMRDDKLSAEDVAALVADARVNGKFGRAPVQSAPQSQSIKTDSAVCPQCGTHCYGDCR